MLKWCTPTLAKPIAVKNPVSKPVRLDSLHQSKESSLRTCKSIWAMSWFWVNSWKAAWVMSRIDSGLRDTAWVMSWFASISQESTWVESPKKVMGSQHLNGSPKRSTVELNARKRSKPNWERIVSLVQELIQINISNFFESWVDLNRNSEKCYEPWVDLNQNSVRFFESLSRFESNFRNLFLIVVIWFKSILVEPLRVMIWAESKLT